jgi:hypothetical protein
MQDDLTSIGNCCDDHTDTANQNGAETTKISALIGNYPGDKATVPKLLY